MEKTVTILVADAPTAAGHVYSRAELEDMLKRNTSSTFYGELGTSSSFNVDTRKVCHVVTNLRLLDSGELVGDVQVLKTPYGQRLEQLLSDGRVAFGLRTTRSVVGSTIITIDAIPKRGDANANPQ